MTEDRVREEDGNEEETEVEPAVDPLPSPPVPGDSPSTTLPNPANEPSDPEERDV